MIRIVGCFLSAFLFALLIADLHAETLTLTTYYPAPYGAYDQLRLVPRIAPEGKCNVGTMYVDGKSHQLMICNEQNNWARVTVLDIIDQLQTDIADKEKEIQALEKKLTGLQAGLEVLKQEHEKDIRNLRSDLKILSSTVDKRISDLEIRQQALEQLLAH